MDFPKNLSYHWKGDRSMMTNGKYLKRRKTCSQVKGSQQFHYLYNKYITFVQYILLYVLTCQLIFLPTSTFYFYFSNFLKFWIKFDTFMSDFRNCYAVSIIMASIIVFLIILTTTLQVSLLFLNTFLFWTDAIKLPKGLFTKNMFLFSFCRLQSYLLF